MDVILNVLLVSAVKQFAFLYINLKPELICLIMVLAVPSPDKFWSISMNKYLILLCDLLDYYYN
jgi:hypothetical protein